jgi:putative exporter of polyketide antibiotics
MLEVVVASTVLAILLGAAYQTAVAQRRGAVALVLRERALQALEYEAEALVRGVAVDPAERGRRLESLPGALFATRDVGDTTVMTLTWRRPVGDRVSMELVVYRGVTP